ncbi:Tautomerase/MIF [Fomitiporia mediterranea MF3/22]|uniref:Tautomerase/MIF n=1 Tax=Fomitiporia mediterranea (strain MF3/22) TaxID=694068 RepID=UPI0004407769|nr:Tautomerase/MIF [Fomitiporia mediterranea MF3/22]EJC98926.1 Tautomerase/MIF [Fomitiporia mediterranea MF3/22]
MPEINLTTNIKVEDPKALVLGLSKLGSELLGYSEAHFQARYTYNEFQLFAGSFDPAFSLEIKHIAVTPETSEKYTKAFSEFLTSKLGVRNDRGFVICQLIEKENVGFMGTTVEKILRAKAAANTA